MNREVIALDQAHHLIIGKRQRHIQAISRGRNLGLVQEGGQILIGLAGPVALVEQVGLQEGGEGIGVIRGSAHGFKAALDATAGTNFKRECAQFGEELLGLWEFRNLWRELLHCQARVRRAQDGPDHAAAVCL